MSILYYKASIKFIIPSPSKDVLKTGWKNVLLH